MRTAKKAATQATRATIPHPEYLAAVRYPDGRRELFRIRNASDLADARELVMLEVGDVQSVLIAQAR